MSWLMQRANEKKKAGWALCRVWEDEDGQNQWPSWWWCGRLTERAKRRRVVVLLIEPAVGWGERVGEELRLLAKYVYFSCY